MSLTTTTPDADEACHACEEPATVKLEGVVGHCVSWFAVCEGHRERLGELAAEEPKAEAGVSPTG